MPLSRISTGWSLSVALWATICCAQGAGPRTSFEWSFGGCASTAGSIVRSFAQDSEGRLWLGTDNGLVRHDGTHATSFAARFPNIRGPAYSMASDSRGFLWIGHGNGLTCIETASLKERPIPEGLPEVEVRAVRLRDNGSALWVCSMAGLFVSSRGEPFVPVDLGDGITMAFSLAWTEDGTAFVGTNEKLLSLKNGQVEEVVLPAKSGKPAEHSYRAVFVGPDGTIWVGCRRPGALYRKTEAGWQRLGAEDGLTDDRVNVIVADPDGSTWLGTEHGVFRWTGSAFQSFTAHSGLECDDIHGLYFTHEGQLWIGTYGAGALRLNSRHVMNYSTRQGLPHPFILSLAQVGPDTTYIGTAGGPCMMARDGKITAILCQTRPISSDLPHDSWTPR